jgi:hypothetical protein
MTSRWLSAPRPSDEKRNFGPGHELEGLESISARHAQPGRGRASGINAMGTRTGPHRG